MLKSLTMPQRLQRLAEAGLVRMARHARPDCCILATACAIDALRELGFEAWPMSVECIVVNKTHGEWYRKHGQDAIRRLGMDAYLASGAWSVGIDRGMSGPGKWAGHLVCRIDRWFLDLSIEQFHRPQYAIDLSRCVPVFKYTPGGEQMTFQGAGGVELMYREVAGDESFRDAPDWVDERRREPIVRELIGVYQRSLP